MADSTRRNLIINALNMMGDAAGEMLNDPALTKEEYEQAEQWSKDIEEARTEFFEDKVTVVPKHS